MELINIEVLFQEIVYKGISQGIIIALFTCLWGMAICKMLDLFNT